MSSALTYFVSTAEISFLQNAFSHKYDSGYVENNATTLGIHVYVQTYVTYKRILSTKGSIYTYKELLSTYRDMRLRRNGVLARNRSLRHKQSWSQKTSSSNKATNNAFLTQHRSHRKITRIPFHRDNHHRYFQPQNANLHILSRTRKYRPKQNATVLHYIQPGTSTIFFALTKSVLREKTTRRRIRRKPKSGRQENGEIQITEQKSRHHVSPFLETKLAIYQNCNIIIMMRRRSNEKRYRRRETRRADKS